jgi:hypothetical protein
MSSMPSSGVGHNHKAVAVMTLPLGGKIGRPAKKSGLPFIGCTKYGFSAPSSGAYSDHFHWHDHAAAFSTSPS